MEREADPLLRKCKELIEMLRVHEDHRKLQALLEDLEALRDGLLAEREEIFRKP